MNTTTTAPDPGYYTPTPADCEEAGLKLGLFRPSDTVHAQWDGGDATIVWEPLTGPTLKHHSDESQDRELVFGDRDKCMAFLRNHMVTAAEPVPDGYEVVPLVDKDGKFYKHIVIPVIDRESYPQFKGKIVMSATLEEMADACKMWDDSAPTLAKDGGYVGRIVISSSIEESNLPTEEFQRMWDSAATNHSGGLTRMFTPKKDEGGAE